MDLSSITLNAGFFSVLRLLVAAGAAFALAMLWAPFLIRFLQKRKLGKSLRDASQAPVFAALHAAKAGTPTMGGVLMWATVLAIAGVSWLGCVASSSLCAWNFVSRGQTWLPIGAMVAAALVGLVDDYLNVRRIGPNGGGLRARHRMMTYAFIAVIVAWWFEAKLDWHVIHVPFAGDLALGWLAIPFFALTIVATSFSVNETDGLDGLAGGPLMAAFSAYAVIAFTQGRFDLAAFCAAAVGTIMAFLWFNVHPAAFFMGDTGAMSLGVALGVVALLTNQVLLLPVIGFVFVVEALSYLIQVTSKKLRNGKKVFLSAPIHHHLEATGWKEPQIVFRAWIVSFFAAGAGIALHLLDRWY